MENEIIIAEYASFFCRYEDGSYAPVVGEFIASQVLDIGTRSAKLDERTKLVSIMHKDGTAFWYKTGDSSVSAVANTDGNRFLPAGVLWNFGVGLNERYIDTAALV